jgi:CRISPR system Cascade subunit CasA
MLSGDPGQVYVGFRKEQFGFTVKGLWPHVHGTQTWDKAKKEWKYVSFTTTAPAWTLLSQFVVPSPLTDDAKEGATPAAPVNQASEVFPGEPLHLLVGGYRAKQASILERRHELFTLAEGWEEDRRGQIKALVEIGKGARSALRGKLWFTAQGDKDKGMKGIGVPLHEAGDKLFYAQTEILFQETLRERLTFKERQRARANFAARLANTCRQIFEELTNPYTMKPELIPVIAWARRSLNIDLVGLTGGSTP